MRRPLGGLILAAAGAATLGWGLLTSPPALRADTQSIAAARLVRLETRRIREADIRFFEARIARDPSGALDLVRLAGLFLERASHENDDTDFQRAEAVARRAIANSAIRDAGGQRTLAAALLAQHRFAEARQAAEAALRLAPEDPPARAALGEILLELGEYPAADSVFRVLGPQRYAPAVAPRYARWLEVRGKSGAARLLLEAARDGAAWTDNEAARVWYELRLGEMALRYGAYREAARRLEAGLALAPDDWRLLAARARLALATGDYLGAAGFGDSALARRLDPQVLATVGDALVALGRRAEAGGYFKALETMAGRPGRIEHRGWSLALLDHDLRIPEVLAAARAELVIRSDLYGFDLLAWALYKSGRYPEARAAMARALAVGTDDPEVLARARKISAAP